MRPDHFGQEIKMSTKAKLGKDWIKAQLMLMETGETLHLTLPPGSTGVRVVAWIDGHTVTGRLELQPIDNVDARGPDATMRLRFPTLEQVTPAPVVAPVAPAPVVAASAPAEGPTVSAPAAVEEAPEPAAVEAAVEKTDDAAVQESAPPSEDSAIKPASEGRRKRR
jgi:hypothetical protein